MVMDALKGVHTTMPVPTPLLTSILPYEIPVNATTAMTITGLGLTGITLLMPGGIAASSVVVVSDTQVTANFTVPIGMDTDVKQVRAQVSNLSVPSNPLSFAIMNQAEVPNPGLGKG
jgi:hypothetical protein